jgi:serine/threonine-protein kinase
MITNLGRYEITGELGRGAMGVVYKAKDPLIDRDVAIKTIDLQNLDPEERKDYEARFYQEARAAGRLNHPNIVTIYDLGENNGIAYIAMEILEGNELHQLLSNGQPLSTEQVLDIAIQVAEGLAYAHEHGIVHRDVKPSNIMLLKNGQVKIADFGIARMESSLLKTRVGVVMGSPLYMSPEQVKNSGIDARSDIFSLGIMLYKMLTGQLPFTGDSANTVMYQIAHETPRSPGSLNPQIPATLQSIVAKCLEKRPEDRYQDALALSLELRECRDTLRGKITDNSLGKGRVMKLAVIALILFLLFEMIEKIFFPN